MKSNQQQLNACSSGVELLKGLREGKKDSLWCTHCKTPRHNRERCWKLHGKPSNTQNTSWTVKSNQEASQRLAHLTSTQSKSVKEFSQERSKFNKEEIEKLRYFMRT